MRNTLCLLASAAATALFMTGCAGPEQKLGRGFDNTFEIVRGGEMRRSVEQTALFDSPDQGYTEGAIHGFDRTLARTGVGLWEVITFPIPNHKGDDYGPIATDYLQPQTVYPDNYKPKLLSDSTFDTDSDLGFSGGDVAPIIPGSRFHVFQ